MTNWLIACAVVTVVLWLSAGVWIAIDHARVVRDCQDYLKAHEGEDRERDRGCWQTIHEGQG